MGCRHGAMIDVEGGMKCLLCGEIIKPTAAQKQPEKAAEEPKVDKPTTRKRPAKKAE